MCEPAENAIDHKVEQFYNDFKQLLKLTKKLDDFNAKKKRKRQWKT